MTKFKHKRNNTYSVINLTNVEFLELRNLLESFGFKLYDNGTDKRAEWIFLNKNRYKYHTTKCKNCNKAIYVPKGQKATYGNNTINYYHKGTNNRYCKLERTIAESEM